MCSLNSRSPMASVSSHPEYSTIHVSLSVASAVSIEWFKTKADQGYRSQLVSLLLAWSSCRSSIHFSTWPFIQPIFYLLSTISLSPSQLLSYSSDRTSIYLRPKIYRFLSPNSDPDYTWSTTHLQSSYSLWSIASNP